VHQSFFLWVNFHYFPYFSFIKFVFSAIKKFPQTKHWRLLSNEVFPAKHRTEIVGRRESFDIGGLTVGRVWGRGGVMGVCGRSFSTATQCKGEERGVKCALNFNRGSSCHYCVSANGKAFFGSHL